MIVGRLPLSLEEFLQEFPWSDEWSGSVPLDYLWEFRLNVAVEDLWPRLIDTSSFNRLMELPQMHFHEEDGKLYGWSVNGGLRLEWEEVPWEWEYGRQMVSARRYSKGFPKYVRGIYLVEEISLDETLVQVYFGWIPRSLFGRTLLKMYMPTLEKKYGAALDTVVRGIQDQRAIAGMGNSFQFSEEARKSIDEIKTSMVQHGIDAGLVDRIVEYIETASEDDLYRLRVPKLAREWHLPLDTLLTAFLYGSRQGLFTISWDVICPHCRGVRQEVNHLGELPEKASCDVCDIDFDAAGVEALEVTFHVHPSIREVQKRFYCAAEPATKPHIAVQKNLMPGELRRLDFLPPSGQYRLRVKGEKDYVQFQLKDRVPVKQFVYAGETSMESGGSGADQIAEPGLYLRTPADQPRVYVLEKTTTDNDALRPSQVFSFQDFRDLFDKEALATGLKLDIGNQTILFTDVVGSTRFYKTVGDAGAFARIQQHFVTAHEIIRNNRGALVKTIGDAIMAAFTNPADALRSAVMMQRSFTEGNPADVRLRISVHTGPCLAVNLNNGIDYFGNSVNLTAKMQAFVEAGQVVYSDTLQNDPQVQDVIAEEKLTPVELPVEDNGPHVNFACYRLDVS